MAAPTTNSQQRQRSNEHRLLLAFLVGWGWTLLFAPCGVHAAPSIVYGDALGPEWFINNSFTGRYVDDNTFVRAHHQTCLRQQLLATFSTE